MKVFIQTDSLFEALFDKMADWLRKLNANPLCSARVVSNPTLNSQLKVFIQTDSLYEALFDKMVDWLRKLNADPF